MGIFHPFVAFSPITPISRWAWRRAVMPTMMPRSLYQYGDNLYVQVSPAVRALRHVCAQPGKRMEGMPAGLTGRAARIALGLQV